MSLASGSRLGPYEIAAPIGAGGMGEVFRARDTRLGRDVAIKVLPPAFAEDAERLKRFEQEARATGALNHPNIVAVHDVGAHEGSPYLVMELLEGETLRQRLGGRPLPVRPAIEIARGIAQGLAAAHDKGIVHRDLKPENVFLTKDGRVKILDFGLAKSQAPVLGAFQDQVATQGVGSSPSLTEAGVLLGTVGYMSPEQVRREKLDGRSDLFALGTLLWEILTGQRPFRGPTALETLNAILKDEPPELDAALKIPPALERLLRSCLAKEPAGRFHSAHDLAFALQGVSDASAGSDRRVGSMAVTRGGLGFLARPWLTATLGILLLFSICVSAWLTLRKTPSPPVVRTLITAPKGVDIVGRGMAIGIALSPDGKKLAYVGATDSTTCLFLRPLDSLDAEPIPGTANARHPFWSPDGREIAFFADRKLKAVTVAGGSARILCETGQFPQGGFWAEDGTIYFGRDAAGPIFRIGGGGGTPTPVSKLDSSRNEWGHTYPHLLPGGHHLLFQAGSSTQSLGLRVLSLDTSQVEFILPRAFRAEVLRDVVVYAERGALLAQRFDPQSVRPLGQTVVLARGLQPNLTVEPHFSLAAEGTLACLLPSRPDSSNLAWFDDTGRRLGSVGSSPEYRNALLSPDGSRIATDVQGVGEEGDRSEVRLIDIRSGTETRVTADSAYVSDPIWSPDGSRLALTSWVSSGFRILELEARGAAKPKALFERPGIAWARDWDSRALLIDRYGDPNTVGDILALSPGDPSGPRPYRATKANEFVPRFSPDGSHVAYASDETGREEVFVAGFPEPGTPRLVSSAGARNPKWGRDGTALYYLSPDEEILKVPVQADGGRLAFGRPIRLFRVRTFPYNAQPFDVHPDGRRFLVSTANDAGTAIVLIQNWTAELK